MKIGGLLKFSLIDYPGKRSAVIFTQGCNLRCPYCHNPELVLPDLFRPSLPQEEVLSFLAGRRGALEGVVITGGEPTLHHDLLDFLRDIRALGFLIKLDSNGTRPQVLRDVIDRELVDYLAMDVKSSLARYRDAVGVDVDLEAIRQSIAILKEGKVAYEFRTTACRPVCQLEDLRAIRLLTDGAPCYRLQKFVPGPGVLDPSICQFPQYTSEEFNRLSVEMSAPC